MLEVRFNMETDRVTAWCGDETQFGNLKCRPGEGIALIHQDPPAEPGDYVLKGGRLLLEPGYKPPINWPEEYDRAVFISDQVDVIARRLNLK